VEADGQAATEGAGAAQGHGHEKGRGGGRAFELGSDRRGAGINGALYGVYAVVSLYLAVFLAQPNSVWFYAFYFMFFLAVFQGFTVVARHCLHLTPKSVVRLEVVGKKLRLGRKNGDAVELTRDVDYTRRKGILVLQGRTHDNQKINEVIREGTLGAEAFESLVTSLKRFR
jgi:hypothetical protein